MLAATILSLYFPQLSSSNNKVGLESLGCVQPSQPSSAPLCWVEAFLAQGLLCALLPLGPATEHSRKLLDCNALNSGFDIQTGICLPLSIWDTKPCHCRIPVGGKETNQFHQYQFSPVRGVMANLSLKHFYHRPCTKTKEGAVQS